MAIAIPLLQAEAISLEGEGVATSLEGGEMECTRVVGITLEEIAGEGGTPGLIPLLLDKEGGEGVIPHLNLLLPNLKQCMSYNLEARIFSRS